MLTLVGGNGGNGGSGGDGAPGYPGWDGAAPVEGGLGGYGGSGSSGGAGAAITGTYTNDGTETVFLSIVAGENGANGGDGFSGMSGGSGGGGEPSDGEPGMDGGDGQVGGDGTSSAVYLLPTDDDPILLFEAKSGTGGTAGTAGKGGQDGKGDGTKGAEGLSGVDGVDGVDGSTYPDPLPNGWTSITNDGSPRVDLSAPVIEVCSTLGTVTRTDVDSVPCVITPGETIEFTIVGGNGGAGGDGGMGGTGGNIVDEFGEPIALGGAGGLGVANDGNPRIVLGAGDTPEPPAPSTTTPPTTTPPTTTVAPVPTDNGNLPDLAPGVYQVYQDGKLVGDGFELELEGVCANAEACTIRTDADGRQVIELTTSGDALVSGSGFQPSSTVHVWMFSTPTYLGALTVNADGSFAGSFDLDGLAVGEHTVQVNGVSADGVARTANLGVVVTGGTVTGTLPDTGSSTGSGAAALVLLAAGVALVIAARRRTTTKA